MKVQTSRQLDNLLRTGDGVFAVDQEQRIIFWNGGAQTILGYAPEEMVGRYCYEIMRGNSETGEMSCVKDCPIVDCGQRGEFGPGQNVLVNAKDGSRRWLGMTHLFSTPLETGPAAVVHVFRDLTAEIEAKRLVERMAHEMAGLGLPSPPKGQPVKAESELTGREGQVLELLARGGSTGSIAKALSISNTTARNHIQNILAKLEVHTRLEAVAYALKNRLVDLNGP